MSIQIINTTDTPNAGRIKINSNFESVANELDNKLNIDGSNSVQSSIDMGGNRIVNAGAGIDDDDYITKSQMITETNHLVVRRYIYCNPDYNQNQKVLYLDGTSPYFGIKVDTISTALAYTEGASDGTKYEWSIKVPYKYDFWKNESFVHFSSGLNIFGEGRPVVEISDGTVAGVADIMGNSRIEGMTLIYRDGKELNLGDGVKIDNCDIFLSNTSGFLPRKININTAIITRSRLIADSIVLDSTTGNYIDDCVINVENFTNPTNNDANTTNKTNTNLANYFKTYEDI